MELLHLILFVFFFLSEGYVVCYALTLVKYFFKISLYYFYKMIRQYDNRKSLLDLIHLKYIRMLIHG